MIPRKCDYRTDTQTDAEQSEPYVLLCFAGYTKTRIEGHSEQSVSYMLLVKTCKISWHGKNNLGISIQKNFERVTKSHGSCQKISTLYENLSKQANSENCGSWSTPLSLILQ